MKLERERGGLVIELDDFQRHVVTGAQVPGWYAYGPDWSGNRASWGRAELHAQDGALFVRVGGFLDHEGGLDTWTDEKVFRSDDGGRTWTPLAEPRSFAEAVASLSTSWDALPKMGDYRLDVRVRSTPVGDVWEAFDVDDQPCWIHVTSRIEHDEAARARVAAVAEKLATVEQENVVGVRRVVNAPGAPLHIVTEQLFGAPLPRKVSSGDARRIGIQLLAGLEAVHAAGVVHGYIRPSNVYVVRSGSRAVLTDVGVVLAAEDPGGTRGSLCMPNDAGYAPFDAAWPPKKMNAACDVFGVGVLLYELVTGERAFGEAMPAMAMNQLKGVPPLATVAKGVDQRLANAVDRATAKDAKERFTTAREMRDALA